MIDLVRDTGLSQNAVRGLYYNTSKGIQFETLEIICDYLKVDPGDVIKKIDFQTQIINKKVDNEYGFIEYEIDFLYNQKKYTGVIEVRLFRPELYELYERENCDVSVDITYSDNLDDLFSQITELEMDKLENKLIDDFIETLGLESHFVTSVSFLPNKKGQSG